jgi:hypothetical protein
MPGALQTIQYAWSKTRQSTNDRRLQPGELTSLVNYRRTKDGEWEKRLGQVKTDLTTFVGASFAGPATQLEASETVIFRDSSDQLWSRNETDGKGYYRGVNPRATPRWFEVENQANLGARKPQVVLVGADLVYIAMGHDISGTAGYQITVYDAATKAMKTATRRLAAAGIKAYTARVANDGKLWVAWVNGTDGVIKVDRYASGPSSAPTTSTYDTVVGAVFVSVDMIADTTNGYTFLAAASSKDNAGARLSGVYRSRASTTATPNLSSFTTNSAATLGTTEVSPSLRFLRHNPALGTVRLAWGKLVSGGNIEIELQEFSETNVTTVTPTTMASFLPAGEGSVLAISGYHDSVSGNRVVYYTYADLGAVGPGGGYTDKCQLIVTRLTYNGSSTTPLVVARSAWVAGDPFQVGSSWYFLTGFDDDDNSGSDAGRSRGAQNGFFVRRADGSILTTLLDGEGGFAFFGAPEADSGHYGSLYANHIANTELVSATEMAVGLLNIGLVRNRPGLSLATARFSDSYYSAAAGVLSGVVSIVDAQDNLSEITPIHGPYQALSFPGGQGTGNPLSTNYIGFLYRVTTADGRVGRSFPYLLSTAYEFLDSTDHFTARLPTCRHTLGARIDIELYGSEDDFSTLYLQDSVLNDPTVDYVDLVIYPKKWSVKTEGEILYTSGGGLANNAPEHARLTWKQGARTMLGGTPSGNIWPSRDEQPGLLPEFNAASSFTWEQGTGELMAGEQVDAQTSALFKVDAIALASGNPDGRGSGGYIVTTLSTKKGCSNPAAVVRGPLGIYFPNATDGRMCVLAGGAISEIHQGMEDYRGYTWVAAVDCPEERCVRWYATNGKRLVLDYSQSSPEDPSGVWILEEGAGLPTVVGARLIDGEAVALDVGSAGATAIWSASAGSVSADFLDNGTQVLTDAVSGRMGLAGFQNSFGTHLMTLSSTWLGGASAFEYTLTHEDGTTEVHADAANEVDDVEVPTGLERTREVRLRIRETSATGRGRSFDGVAIAVRPDGRIKPSARQSA